MKHLLLLLCIFICTNCSKPSDNSDTVFIKDSGFVIEQLNNKQITNLTEICKAWGYLKYNSSVVSEGNYNWDYELFKILPIINSTSFTTELDKWVAAFGKENWKNNRKTYNSIPVSINTSNYFSLNRIIPLLNENHKYIKFRKGINNPIFTNEKAYPNMHWNDNGFQLLALFRYWNMIEYFYPYKHLIKRNWSDILSEYIPKLLQCNSELSYKLIMLELIGEIHDSHAYIINDEVITNHFGSRAAPFKVSFIEGKAVIVNKFNTKNSKIKVGDVILAVNGKSVDELVNEKKKYCTASNYPTTLRNLSSILLRTSDSTITLQIENGRHINTYQIGTIDVETYRSLVSKKDKPSNFIINGNIGYIYPGSLNKSEIHTIMKSFMHKKGLIIDLRCYPSDFIVFKLSNYLMPEPIEFVKFSNSSLGHIGEFYFSKSLTVGDFNKNYYKGKIVILVNEITQSNAEYTTMALKVAPKAVVLGSTTSGADGNVSKIILPGDIATNITGIGVYYPDGTGTQRVGIVPDIEFKPTIEGIRKEKDELLEKAISLINE